MHRHHHPLVFLLFLFTLCLDGCVAPCPEGFLRDNDGNCLQVDGDDEPRGDLDGDGVSADEGDCDDNDPTIRPGAAEQCDEVDSDCDGSLVDEFADSDGDLAPDCTDADDDNDGDLDDSDCADLDPAVYTGAPEIPDDGVDQDCSGTDSVTCFQDEDEDGFGTAGTLISDNGVCADAGGAEVSGDCAPTDPAVFPGAPELCDALDSDCDLSLVDEFIDTDGDGEPDCVDLDDDGDGAADGEDCQSLDPLAYPGATDVPDDGIDQDCNGFDTVTCFEDLDGDGFGTSSLLAPDGDCNDAGESPAPADCDDSTPSVFPGAPELCDVVDSDCDLSLVDEFADTDVDGAPDCTDMDDDADGDPDATDCAPLNPTVFTGAPETPDDGVDQDCNGFDTVTCFEDLDGDGVGTSSLTASDGDCADPGEATASGDCDDGAALVYPGAPESCDALDSDCDLSLVDEFADTDADGDPDCIDSDDDGDGDPDPSDCAPLDPAVFAGAPETLDDGIDQDCNGFDSVTCYQDLDGDGVGSSVLSPGVDGDCADPGESSVATDCDDGDATTFPGAQEFCDGVDSDCDLSLVDEFFDTDIDGDPDCNDPDDDGDGDPDTTDCASLDPAIFAGAPEVLDDGVDQDCNGFDSVTCYEDLDGDGVGSSVVTPGSDGDCADAGESTVDTDCDDNDGSTYPGATEFCDGVDSDCDFSLVDEFLDTDSNGDPDCTDPDDDGDGDPDATDCAPLDPSVGPSAAEVPDDGIDQDCDGVDATLCFEDWDGDGYGDPAVPLVALDGDCLDPAEAGNPDDCDDGDFAVSPAQLEADYPDCEDGVDQDCDGAVDWSDDSCACAVKRAAEAGVTISCPGQPLSGTAGQFSAQFESIELVDDPNEPGLACTPPFYVTAGSDMRGFNAVVSDIDTMLGTTGGVLLPFWASDILTPTGWSWFPSFLPDNCIPLGSRAGCAFPGTPSTQPLPGCYALSWVGDAAVSGATGFADIALDRSGQLPDRIDIHAVTAGATPITQDQIIDALSYMAQVFETAGLSLGTVSFENIPSYQFIASSDLSQVVATPSRAGATSRAVTVVFVEDILEPGLLGQSAGIPGAIGIAGTGASGVVFETAAWWSGGTPDLDGLGAVIAHEVGHYLGLHHTSQTPVVMGMHDTFTDTPECTNGGSDGQISPSECVGQGVDNIMFPVAPSSVSSVSFSPQQADVLGAVAPREWISCTAHTDCAADEICETSTGACERAWARDYTVFIDDIVVSTTGPSGSWDSGFSSSIPPDPFLEWCVGSTCSTTSVVSDSYAATWGDVDSAFMLKSQSDAWFESWDEDVIVDDFIDYYGASAPIPLTWLRSPYLTLPGYYSTLNIGFEPQ